MNQERKLVIHEARNNESSRVELFDLEADPGETTNLSDQEPEVVLAMKRQLRTWQESVLKSLTEADYGVPPADGGTDRDEAMNGSKN